MGQVAGIMHGSRELTGDLDLLRDGDERQCAALASGFARVGARLTGSDGRALGCEAAAFRLAKVLFRSASASGDCRPIGPDGLRFGEFSGRPPACGQLIGASDGEARPSGGLGRGCAPVDQGRLAGPG